MIHTIEMANCKPVFMKILTGFRAIIWSCVRNLRVYKERKEKFHKACWEMSLGAYLPSFMKIGTGFKAMLKFFSAI
jgi:hypothetical protein